MECARDHAGRSPRVAPERLKSLNICTRFDLQLATIFAKIQNLVLATEHAHFSNNAEVYYFENHFI